jgi:hypothetical protein
LAISASEPKHASNWQENPMLLDKYLPRDEPPEAPAPDPGGPLLDICFGIPAVLAADAYALHQTLELTIGTRARTGYLHTVVLEGDRAVCVVRSRAFPPHLMEKAVPVPVLEAGGEASFSVHTTLTMKTPDGKRKPIRHDNTAARVRWLDRNAATSGFRVIEASNSTSQRWISRKGKRFWLDDTLFIGRLEVTDAAAFARTLGGGFGQGAAWGFGLLRITPS